MIAPQCSHHLCQPAAHHCRSCGMPICRHCPGWRRLSPACYACLYKNHNSLFPLPRHLLGLRQLRVGVDALSALLVIGYTWTEIVLLASIISEPVLGAVLVWFGVEADPTQAAQGTLEVVLLWGLLVATIGQFSAVLLWPARRGLGVGLFCLVQAVVVFVGVCRPELVSPYSQGDIDFGVHWAALVVSASAVLMLLCRPAAAPLERKGAPPLQGAVPETPLPTLWLPRLFVLLPALSFLLLAPIATYRLGIMAVRGGRAGGGISLGLFEVVSSDVDFFRLLLVQSSGLDWFPAHFMFVVGGLFVAFLIPVPLVMSAFRYSRRQLRMPVTRSGPDRVAFSRLEGVLSPVLDQRWRVRLVQSLNPAGDISTSGGRRGAIIHLPKGAIHNIKNSGGVSDQTRAILGHELTHVQQDSTLFSSVLFLSGFWLFLAYLVGDALVTASVFARIPWMTWWEVLLNIPHALILSGLHLAVLFALIQIGQHREFEADRGALVLFSENAQERASLALEISQHRPWSLTHPARAARQAALQHTVGELPIPMSWFVLYGWGVGKLLYISVLLFGQQNLSAWDRLPDVDVLLPQLVWFLRSAFLVGALAWSVGLVSSLLIFSVYNPTRQGARWRRLGVAVAQLGLFTLSAAVSGPSPVSIPLFLLVLGVASGRLVGVSIAWLGKIDRWAILSGGLATLHLLLLAPLAGMFALFAVLLVAEDLWLVSWKIPAYTGALGLLLVLTVLLMRRWQLLTSAHRGLLLLMSVLAYVCSASAVVVVLPDDGTLRRWLLVQREALYRPITQDDLDLLPPDDLRGGLQRLQQMFYYDGELNEPLVVTNLSLHLAGSSASAEPQQLRCVDYVLELEEVLLGRGLSLGRGNTFALVRHCLAHADPSIADRLLGPHVQQYGALVTGVVAGYPAAELGIGPGDLIVRYNQRNIESRAQLIAAVLRCSEPGACAGITVEYLDAESQERRSVSVPPGKLGVFVDDLK